MDTDNGRLYMAVAQMLLGRAYIVAPSSGFIAVEWQLLNGSLGQNSTSTVGVAEELV
jgi:hypothetical protein